VSMAVWEPITFAVGDRIRVRVSLECRVEWLTNFPPGHPIEEDGVCGTVVSMPAQYVQEPWVRSHPYAVAFDAPGIRVNGEWWWGGMFAAVELEPLTAASTGAAPGRARGDQP